MFFTAYLPTKVSNKEKGKLNPLSNSLSSTTKVLTGISSHWFRRSCNLVSGPFNLSQLSDCPPPSPPPPYSPDMEQMGGDPKAPPLPPPIAPTTILRILHRLSISQACLIRCISFFTLFEKIISCSVNQLWISCRKKNLFKRNLKFMWKKSL